MRGQRGATNLVVLPGAAREPGGDLIQADLARECVQEVLSGLRELGVDRRGSISVQAVDMAIGAGVRRASAMRQATPPTLSSGRRSSHAPAKTRR